jgi:radical SAM superfamily enzyme YgiQ (UPF0313 family)
MKSLTSGVCKTLKVLFVIPKGRAYSGAGTYNIPGFPHTGVAYLTAVLQQNRVEVKILDMAIGYSINDLFRTIDEFEPNLVGVTSFSYGCQDAYEIIRQIKLHGNHMIVIGGPHVSAFRGEVLNGTKADFAVKEEGEYTLLELCRAIESTQNYQEVKGLIWRKGDKVIENSARPLIQDLDALPFPAYEKFELQKYLCYDRKLLPIITSRGCPCSCVFCSVKLSMGRKFRARSPENVVSEIEYWYHKGWRNFDINDDNFTCDMNRAMKICDLIIERKLDINYKIYNGIRVDRVSKELLYKMKESGCILIEYGVESANEEVLKRIKKGISLGQVRKAVEMANEVGINSAVNFIIGHPGETLEKAMDSIRFAESLPTKFVNFFNLVPYPGTELFQWVKNNATFLYPEETYLTERCYGADNPVFETKEFRACERKQVARRGILLYRKKVLQFKLGRVFGLFVYLFARSNKLWELSTATFMGTRMGGRIFHLITHVRRAE